MSPRPRARLANSQNSGTTAAQQSGQENSAKDSCQIVKHGSRYGQENMVLEQNSDLRRSSEGKIAAIHPAPMESLQTVLFGRQSTGVLKAMEQAVSEIGTELGSAMGKLGRDLDRWGNRIESKVEELLPGWVPPVSAFEEALDAEFEDGMNPERQSTDGTEMELRPSTRNHPAASQGWDDWDWSYGEAERQCAEREREGNEGSTQLSDRRLKSDAQTRKHRRRDRSGARPVIAEEPPEEHISVRRQDAGVSGRAVLTDVTHSEQHESEQMQGRAMPPVSNQAYHQLQQTLMHLLDKHDALKEENIKLVAENQTLQGIIDLMALQHLSDDESCEEAVEASIPSSGEEEPVAESTEVQQSDEDFPVPDQNQSLSITSCPRSQPGELLDGESVAEGKVQSGC